MTDGGSDNARLPWHQAKKRCVLLNWTCDAAFSTSQELATTRKPEKRPVAADPASSAAIVSNMDDHRTLGPGNHWGNSRICEVNIRTKSAGRRKLHKHSQFGTSDGDDRSLRADPFYLEAVDPCPGTYRSFRDRRDPDTCSPPDDERGGFPSVWMLRGGIRKLVAHLQRQQREGCAAVGDEVPAIRV